MSFVVACALHGVFFIVGLSTPCVFVKRTPLADVGGFLVYGLVHDFFLIPLSLFWSTALRLDLPTVAACRNTRCVSRV